MSRESMKISLTEMKTNFDVSILLNTNHLPTKISTGAQILFESSLQDVLLLNEDNFFYILEAAQHFKLHIIESFCHNYFTTHMMKGNSIETLIICEKYFNMYKSTLNFAIRNVCKIFHELTEKQLFVLEANCAYLILNQNYKIECSEIQILEIVLKWMINYEKKAAKDINLRLIIMNIIHSVLYDEITEEDFNKLALTIDVTSEVYDTFKALFLSTKKYEKPNEFRKMIKSYGFPTSRGVEQALVQFKKSDYLTFGCTMPMSKTSPEWEKIYTINIGGCVQDKWSVVYQNNLFVFGNATRSQETFQFGLKYCPSLDEWIKVNELEDGYELTSLNAVGNYFIGIGTFDGKTKKFAMKYDPNLGHWTKIEEMPVLLHQYAAVAFDETLLISGGKKSKDSESTRDFWMYSLVANIWMKLPTMRYGRSSHVMIRNKSKIYFIGNAPGYNEPVEQVEYFDMITQTFQLVTDGDKALINANQIFIKNVQKQPKSHFLELDYCNRNVHKCMYDSIYMYKT